MRTTVTVTGAPGDSAWVPVSYYQNPFSVSLEYSPSTDAAGPPAGSVQHTFDDPQVPHQPQSITRSGTTATVVDPGHGLLTGDCVMVFASGDPNLNTPIGIGADITVVDANTYTYTVANTGLTAALPTAQVITLRVINHAQLSSTGTTPPGASRLDGNYAFPIRACRLKMSALSAGSASLTVTQGAGR
ncbi:MAG TPA: hypothetical protein VLH80_07420 [Nitrospiraceae bacterium]|nr:hypothetical protein [Nitrospiraceae bacterium]